MKAAKKLIPALGMLLISILVVSSASFAWFSMSREVTATGMNVSIVAPNNLLISNKTTAQTDADWASEATLAAVTDVTLYPASTNDGTDFFVLKDGEEVTSAGALFATGSELEAGNVYATGGANNDTAAFYDFQYTLKTEGAEAVECGISDWTLTAGNGKVIIPARMAILAGSTVVGLYNIGESTIEAPSIWAGHYTSGKAVESLDATNYAVLGDVAYAEAITAANKDTNTAKFTVATGATPTVLTVRVWFEGEDKTCTGNAIQAQFSLEVVISSTASLQ